MSLELVLLGAFSFLAGYLTRWVQGHAHRREVRRHYVPPKDMDVEAAKDAVRRLFPDANKTLFIEAKGELLSDDVDRCRVSVDDGSARGGGDDWPEAILDLLDRNDDPIYQDR